MNIAVADASASFFTLRPAQSAYSQHLITSSDLLTPSLSAPQLPLLGHIAPGWRVIQPLLVTLERDEDGCYIVSDDEFAVYGDGSTRFEAIQDYILSLIDYYQLLARRVESDSATEALFRRLQLFLNRN